MHPEIVGGRARTPLRAGLRVLTIVAFLWSAGICGGIAAEPWRVGLLLPPEEVFRESLRRGAEAAVSRHNAKTNARPLELIVRGRSGQWGADADEAGRLVLEDRVQILVAPPGAGPSHLVLQVSGRTRTPVISLAHDDSITGAGIPWAVRLVPSLRDEWGALLRGGSWRFLVEAGRPARELEREWERARVPVGGVGVDVRTNLEARVVGLETGALSDEGVRQRARALVAESVDGVFLQLDPVQAARWVRALRLAGFGGVLTGGGGLRSPGFVEAAGEAARGFRVTAMESSEAPTRVAGSRSIDAAEGLAFEALELAEALLERAGDRPVCTVFPWSPGPTAGTPSGRWRFDRFGNREVRLEVLRWDGAAWNPLR